MSTGIFCVKLQDDGNVGGGNHGGAHQIGNEYLAAEIVAVGKDNGLQLLGAFQKAAAGNGTVGAYGNECAALGAQSEGEGAHGSGALLKCIGHAALALGTAH